MRAFIRFAMIVLVGFTAACGGGTSQTFQSTTVPNALLQLTPASKEFVLPPSTPNPECVPPCFYNIIPGRTTLTATLSLMNIAAEQIESDEFR